MSDVVIHRLTPARRDDFLQYFDRDAFADNPRWQRCYCHWLHADHDAIDWSKTTAEQNRAASSRMIDRGEMTGVLAYRDGKVIGWCNAAPWSAYLALADLAEPDAADTGAIVCFVVAPGARRQGVARALLDAACDGLRAAGLKFAMGKPVRTAQGEAANHFGHLEMFLAAGFTVHRETGQGDVFVRKVLEQQSWPENRCQPARAGTAAPGRRKNAVRGGGCMKKSGSTENRSASELIDEKIARLADWRGQTLSEVRSLIRSADPDVVEEVKWRKPSNSMLGVPVWSHDGIICTGETYKDKVKLTFAKGALLKDPGRLFNSSLDGNSRRAIDIHEGQTVDGGAFRALVRAAAKLNTTLGKERPGRSK